MYTRNLSYQMAQLWLAQRRLYEKLSEEGNPYTNDTDINKFLTNAQTNGLKGYADIQTGLRQMFNISLTDLNDLTAYETQISESLSQLAMKELELSAYGISPMDSTVLTGKRDFILGSLATTTNLRDNKLIGIAGTRASAASTLSAQNNALSGAADYLLNEKTVNNIFLQTIAAGNINLSQAQITTLETIAVQCPLSGGEAVLRARDLLGLTQDAPIFYDDDNLCGPQRPSGRSIGVDTKLGNIISIFPNPANDAITIQYDLKSIGGSRLQFFNAFGQLKKEIVLTDTKGSLILPTGNLVSGVYIYTLNGMTTGRLIINH